MSRIGQAVFELQEKDDQDWMQQHEKIIRPIQAAYTAASDCGWLGRSALVLVGGRDCGGVRAVGGGVQRGPD